MKEIILELQLPQQQVPQHDTEQCWSANCYWPRTRQDQKLGVSIAKLLESFLCLWNLIIKNVCLYFISSSTYFIFIALYKSISLWQIEEDKNWSFTPESLRSTDNKGTAELWDQQPCWCSNPDSIAYWYRKFGEITWPPYATVSL